MHTKDCKAPLSMKASIVFGSLLRQVLPPLLYTEMFEAYQYRKLLSRILISQNTIFVRP